MARLLIERLHEAATEHDYELATSNVRAYDESVPDDHSCRELEIDNEAAKSFLRKYDAPEHTLGRTALYFFNKEIQSLDTPNRNTAGWISSYELYADHESQTVRYPLIFLDVSQHETSEDLNESFLHELRHAADSEKQPFYNRGGAVNSIRLALGVASVAYGASFFNKISDSTDITTDVSSINSGILIASSLACGAGAAFFNRKRSKALLYELSKHEIAARIAARQGDRVLYSTQQ